MPNHCQNDLFVYGKPEEVEALFNKYKNEEGDPLDADKIIPYPDEYKRMDEEYQKMVERFSLGEITREQLHVTKDGFNSGGYWWCVNNWGTKWGMYNFSIKKVGKTYTKVSFESAWSPPLPLIRKMGEDFPNLRIKLKYYECGVAFQGTYIMEGGECIENTEKDYKGNRGG